MSVDQRDEGERLGAAHGIINALKVVPYGTLPVGEARAVASFAARQAAFDIFLVEVNYLRTFAREGRPLARRPFAKGAGKFLMFKSEVYSFQA